MHQLIVGGIHGGYAELRDLLAERLAGPSAEDEIIALGDIVGRGPESPRVLAFFRRQPNALTLMAIMTAMIAPPACKRDSRPADESEAVNGAGPHVVSQAANANKDEEALRTLWLNRQLP
jgi:hypothetical protein